MLGARASVDDLRSQARPLSELIPWMLLLTPQIIVNKDGALIASLALDGTDPEGRDRIDIDHEVEALERAILSVSHPQLSLWWTIERRKDTSYPDQTFRNSASARVDAAYRRDYEARPHYLSRHTVTLVFAEDAKSGKFMEAVARHAAAGANFLQSFWQAGKEAFSPGSRFGADGQALVERSRQFEDLISRWSAALPDMGAHRLQGPTWLGWLQGLASPGDDPQEVRPPQDTSWYLDTRLGSNGIAVFRNQLRFEGSTEKYAGAIGIKMWPNETVPGSLDGLLTVDAEITVSLAMRLMEIGEAKTYIAKIRQNNLNASKGMMTHLKEAMTETPSDNIDTSKTSAAGEADEAMADINTIPLAAWVNLTVMVYAPTPKILEAGILETIKALQRAGLICLRERAHVLSAWAGTLPGQWAEPVRWVFVTGGNLANLAPIRAITDGDRQNRHFTQQRGVPSPALCVFDCARTKSPYFFNWHYEDLGHGFVVGPSRSGKSIFCNLLISQWQKYDPTQIFIFDKDFSCKIPALLHGGAHLDIAQGLRLNPLAGLESPDDWAWFAKWLEMLLTGRGYQLTAADDESVKNALDSVRSLAPGSRRLLSVASTLPKHLAEQLGPWIGEGPWARFFDATTDEFSLSDLVCIEMGSIMPYAVAARAFMDYAFFRIKRRLDGRPTLIYLEEAWFLMENEQFAGMMNDWLRTFAKKNAILVLTTQSLNEIVTSKAFTAIIDNIQTRVYLPNPNVRAHGDLYRDRMGLNETQIQTIGTAVAKSQYFVVTPRLSRLVDMRLSPTTVAWLRSDAKAQAAFEKHRTSGLEDWQDRYLAEMGQVTLERSGESG